MKKQLNKQQSKDWNKTQQDLRDKIQEKVQENYMQGLKAGAAGMVGTILDMLNEGKTREDIEHFCKKFVQVNNINIKL